MARKKTSRSISLMATAVIITGILFSSCEKAYIDFGGNFIDNSTSNIVLIDSATVDVSTLYVDSFVSSNYGTIIAGKYTDPLFGTIESRSFVQLGLPSATYSIPNGSVYDSLQLILKLNKNWYGDSSVPAGFSVYQLLSPISFPANQSYFYNNQQRSYNSTALGSAQFIIRPTITDTIGIRLSQPLGQDLFDKLRTSATETSSTEQFINYFKGIAITGDAANKMILGFNDTVIMRLHYHKPNVFTEKAVIDFSIYDKSYQFNNIIVNRTGTALAALGSTNSNIPSAQTQNAGFSQYISGAMVKLRFPYLRNLLQLPNFTKIIKAELLIKPVTNSMQPYYNLPPQLRLSQTDRYNLPGTDLYTYDASGQSSTQYGNLTIDHLYGLNTGYTYDVTAYMQNQISISENNLNGLLVLPLSPATDLSRIMIADGKNPSAKMKLNIYYASVK